MTVMLASLQFSTANAGQQHGSTVQQYSVLEYCTGSWSMDRNVAGSRRRQVGLRGQVRVRHGSA